MNARRNRKPVQDHRRHPAFIRVLDGLEDVASGIRVLKVQYEQTPEYDGGTYVEVYDSNDDLLDDSYGKHNDLRKALAEALEDFGEDYSHNASLRKRAIKLAHVNPVLRPHLLPLLKEAYGRDVAGKHLIFSPNGPPFSFREVAQDAHGQVYDAAILMDKRRTVVQAVAQVWRKYQRELVGMRKRYEAIKFIEAKIPEFASRPIKGYIKWHMYSMPD